MLLRISEFGRRLFLELPIPVLMTAVDVGPAVFEQSQCLPEFNREFVTVSGLMIRGQSAAHTVPFRDAKIHAPIDDLSQMLDFAIHLRFHLR
jgi:hypothetical protein